ncbi:hypothetical protein PCANC_16674 [Puccinia coronata f. sp. avenae]|uniref:Uncharacterized protein n=1 Tax=Puccinia coronata f. sp. avenae TaxID=200324 RepID=A0A2N5UEL0_9BASI|nr:hypothetical protein PCANC_16674 [Puccinia coronata f. sp. avenae]
MTQEIQQMEILKKPPNKANCCADAHKAADNKRNKSTWKQCNDTSLMGCCNGVLARRYRRYTALSYATALLAAKKAIFDAKSTGVQRSGRTFAPSIKFWPNNTTAGINRSNTDARAVLEQPCLTGGRTDTVRPKREPTGRTDLSDRFRLVLCNRSQELIGQACPTRRQVLRSDSACPTTGRTRLFEHRSNCRVRPVNAGSARRIQK